MTLFILLVYMLGSSIPLPFAQATRQYHQLLNDTPITIISFMSGANLMKLSLFMIGLNPLMIAMLIIQLFTMVKIWGFDTLSINQTMKIQQWVTLLLTLVQAVVMTITLHLARNKYEMLAIIIILTAGSSLVVWLGFMNMHFGIGGTITIILFNIITMSIPTVKNAIHSLMQLPYPSLWLIGLILVSLGMLFFWNAFGHAYYPLKVINTSLSSRDDPVIIPIGLNLGAMMTYMIGMALLMMPTMLGSLLGPKSIFANYYFDATISGILAFMLFYFFTFIQFDPKERAKQLRNHNNYIPNVRPGKPTQKYIRNKLLLLGLPGALLNAIQLVFGLLGTHLLGRYAGFAIIPMYSVMIVMFMTGIKDTILTLLYPAKYERLTRKEA